MDKKIWEKILPILLILFLSFWTLKPLSTNGYFPMHDDTQPTRIQQMVLSLKDGQFPVRWVPDLGYGYGYPIYNFYAPLPYYIGALGMLGSLDLLISTKLMYITGIVLASMTMFYLGRKIWGKWGGLVSAIFYIYAPYHAVQIYVRGAVGEYWAYAFLPLCFLGILESEKNFSKGLLVGSIGFAGVVLSHNITGILLLLFLCLWLIVKLIKTIIRKKGLNCLFGMLGIILVGLGLSAFFWLPALWESGLTKVAVLTQGNNNYRHHFVFIDQLWDSPWGFAGSAPGRNDGMSFKIGKLHLMVGLIMILTLLIKIIIEKSKYYRKIFLDKIVILLLGFLVSILMMLPISKLVWQLIPVLAYVQYPWRFLIFGLFFISLVCGGIVTLFSLQRQVPDTFFDKVNQVLIGITKWLKEDNHQNGIGKIGYLVIVPLIFLVISINSKYFQPKYISGWNENEYIRENATKWQISKISDEYLPKNFPIPQNINQIAQNKIKVNDDIIVKSSEYKSYLWKLNVSVRKDVELIFNLAYFPGWQIVIDTQRVKPLVKDGLISITVPKGDHIVTAYFEDTWIRKIGNWISLITLIFYLRILITKKDYLTLY